MKPLSITLAVVLAATAAWAAPQQGPTRAPLSTPKDVELERQSAKSLDAAKFYFYKRKPDQNTPEAWARLNKSIEGRLIEIMDTNADFARIDEVYFLLGELYRRMDDPDKAKTYWEQALKTASDGSKMKSEAQKRLTEAEKAKPQARK